MSDAPLKPAPRPVKKYYKPALAPVGSPGNREVFLRSFLASGDIVELIGAEDGRTKDDAYIQGVRAEIQKKPPHGGKFAEKLKLFNIATRRICHESDAIEYRHTGPKKDSDGEVMLNDYGNPVYYPRQYITRLVSDEEQAMTEEVRLRYRKKVLNTVAKILYDHEEYQNEKREEKAREKAQKEGKKYSPPPELTPTKFVVPERWDLTPQEPLPLDHYITDKFVSQTIKCVYVEEEIGRWDMFSENVADAPHFFSPPYDHEAHFFGYHNPHESSVRFPAVVSPPKRPKVEQAFDLEDVVALD